MTHEEESSVFVCQVNWLHCAEAFIVIGEIRGRKERREINTTLQAHTSSKNNIVTK